MNDFLKPATWPANWLKRHPLESSEPPLRARLLFAPAIALAAPPPPP
jgi:hypothetical protein